MRRESRQHLKGGPRRRGDRKAWRSTSARPRRSTGPAATADSTRDSSVLERDGVFVASRGKYASRLGDAVALKLRRERPLLINRWPASASSPKATLSPFRTQTARLGYLLRSRRERQAVESTQRGSDRRESEGGPRATRLHAIASLRQGKHRPPAGWVRTRPVAHLRRAGDRADRRADAGRHPARAAAGRPPERAGPRGCRAARRARASNARACSAGREAPGLTHAPVVPGTATSARWRGGRNRAR